MTQAVGAAPPSSQQPGENPQKNFRSPCKMAEPPELSKLDNLVPPNPLTLSKSPRARHAALQLHPAEHEVLQNVVRKHIIRRRWYGLLNIILLRLRQQKFGTRIPMPVHAYSDRHSVRARIRADVEQRVATFLQAFVRSWYSLLLSRIV